MALWVVLVMSLCGLLRGQETQLVQKCCQDGRDRAEKGQHCAVLPFISSSHTCRIAQQHCCVATLEERFCTTGTDMALRQRVCETAFLARELREGPGVRVIKRCCDCCMLGQVAADQGLGCDALGERLVEYCADTAKACCRPNPPEDREPDAGEMLANSTCSQLRAANGSCSCYSGFRLRGDRVSCEDVNECLQGSHNCSSAESCINIPGSFHCQSCGTGYELRGNTSCQDIDECAAGAHICANLTCTNTFGSFRCHPPGNCSVGFIPDANGTCIDIDECVGPRSPCPLGEMCVNTAGSFTCRIKPRSCGRGYRLAANGTGCEDLDECAGNACGIHGCVNLAGSHRCECNSGYTLNSLSNQCEDIDECDLAAGGALCSYKCANNPGSFSCLCPAGYQLFPNRRSCQDIDECAVGTHNCSVSESCFNVLGGFRCMSPQCPQNYKKSSQGRCERVACEFARDPASCRSLPLRISHYTISFPANTPVPADVFRMGPSNSVPGDRMLLSIVSGDEEGHFAVTQQAHGGVISLSRALPEPRDFLLTVEMTLFRYGTPHLYMAKISVFVTRELPIRASRFLPPF